MSVVIVNGKIVKNSESNKCECGAKYNLQTKKCECCDAEYLSDDRPLRGMIVAGKIGSITQTFYK